MWKQYDNVKEVAHIDEYTENYHPNRFYSKFQLSV